MNPAAFPSFWEMSKMRQVQVYRQSATLVHFYSREVEKAGVEGEESALTAVKEFSHVVIAAGSRDWL